MQASSRHRCSRGRCLWLVLSQLCRAAGQTRAGLCAAGGCCWCQVLQALRAQGAVLIHSMLMRSWRLMLCCWCQVLQALRAQGAVLIHSMLMRSWRLMLCCWCLVLQALRAQGVGLFHSMLMRSWRLVLRPGGHSMAVLLLGCSGFLKQVLLNLHPQGVNGAETARHDKRTIPQPSKHGGSLQEEAGP